MQQLLSRSTIDCNPNNKYMPKWEPITAEHHYTMLIDRECACHEAFDEELTALVDKATPRFTLDFSRMFESE